MATAQDMRERQGSGSTMTAPPSDGSSEQFSSSQSDGSVGRANTPGDPDSTFPQAGATDRGEPGTANYRPGQGDTSGSGSADNGDGAGGANAGSTSDTGAGDQSAGGASDSGNDTAGASGGNSGDGSTEAGGETAGSDGGNADGAGEDSGGGLLGSDGRLGGLIPDAMADTQSLGGDVLNDVQSGGSDLVSDAVNGTGQLVGNVASNLGLGDGDGLLAGLPGSGVVGSVTDGLGNGVDLGNVLGDGPALTAGVLGDGNGAIAQPVSDLTGGLTDGILAPNGNGPIAELGVVGSGSPAVTGLLNDAGNDTLGGLGLGRIAEVNGAGDSNGDQDISATAGNDPGQSGPLVNAQAFGSGNPPSNNLIDVGAGPNGENSGVIANVLGGSSDSSNPAGRREPDRYRPERPDCRQRRRADLAGSVRVSRAGWRGHRRARGRARRPGRNGPEPCAGRRRPGDRRRHQSDRRCRSVRQRRCGPNAKSVAGGAWRATARHRVTVLSCAAWRRGFGSAASRLPRLHPAANARGPRRHRLHCRFASGTKTRVRVDDSRQSRMSCARRCVRTARRSSARRLRAGSSMF